MRFRHLWRRTGASVAPVLRSLPPRARPERAALQGPAFVHATPTRPGSAYRGKPEGGFAPWHGGKGCLERCTTGIVRHYGKTQAGKAWRPGRFAFEQKLRIIA